MTIYSKLVMICCKQYYAIYYINYKDLSGNILMLKNQFHVEMRQRLMKLNELNSI